MLLAFLYAGTVLYWTGLFGLGVLAIISTVEFTSYIIKHR